MDNRPKVGVTVFVWRDGRFLVQQRMGSHGEGTWSLPGGHLEYGEAWRDCAEREVFEETGMKIKNIQFLAATNDIFKHEHKHYVSIWLEADWAANEPSIQEPDRLAALSWHTFKDLPAPLFEPCWQNLRKLKPDLFA